MLLILAGVTINLVLGPEGLLKQAQDATDKYKQAENEELNSMTNILAKLETINGGNGTPSEPDNPEKPIDPSTPKPGDIIKTENNIKYTSDGEGNVIPVPNGFSYAGEGTKETGFVIKNDEDLNEFVWIPVRDMPYTYSRYAFSGGNLNQVEDGIDSTTNSTKIKNNSSDSYCFTEKLNTEEKDSIDKYGGYYIARYEAGTLSERTTTNLPTTIPIFRKSGEERVYVYNYVTIGGARTVSSHLNNLYNSSGYGVSIKLCNSYAWDTALKFIETKNPGWATNSVGENYNLDSGGTGKVEKTGCHSVNNIYDMGGNVLEWTSESCNRQNYPLVRRGGYARNFFGKWFCWSS